MANAAAEGIPERAILKEIKLLIKILSTSACRRAMAKLQIDADSVVPWERMTTCGLTTVESFAQARPPQPPLQR